MFGFNALTLHRAKVFRTWLDAEIWDANMCSSFVQIAQKIVGKFSILKIGSRNRVRADFQIKGGAFQEKNNFIFKIQYALTNFFSQSIFNFK